MVLPTLEMSTRLIAGVSTCLKFAHYWLLPGTCVVCRKPSGQPLDLCTACAATLALPERPCPGCALTLPPGADASLLCGRCQGNKRRIQHTVAAFAYGPPVSSLISQFKYHGKLQHGRVLTMLLVERLRQRDAALPPPQLLVPVPLHPARLRERGFNQALVMSRQIGKALTTPVAADLLQRVRQTPPQQGLSAHERKRNLQRAFHVSDTHLLQACHSIALVDDVVTTMSTVSELARLLRRHGRRDLTIHVWCLARA